MENRNKGKKKEIPPLTIREVKRNQDDTVL